MVLTKVASVPYLPHSLNLRDFCYCHRSSICLESLSSLGFCGACFPDYHPAHCLFSFLASFSLSDINVTTLQSFSFVFVHLSPNQRLNLMSWCFWRSLDLSVVCRDINRFFIIILEEFIIHKSCEGQLSVCSCSFICFKVTSKLCPQLPTFALVWLLPLMLCVVRIAPQERCSSAVISLLPAPYLSSLPIPSYHSFFCLLNKNVIISLVCK